MRDPFVVSSISWHEVTDAVAIDNINMIEDALQANLKLSEYGAITGVAFIYIIEHDDNHMHEDQFSYSAKRGEVSTQMRLSYDEVQKSTPEEVLHLMAAKYIDTMLEWLPKKKIANFDWQRFVKDVQDLFERQGWLQAIEVA
jgi:hypothetical protein